MTNAGTGFPTLIRKGDELLDSKSAVRIWIKQKSAAAAAARRVKISRPKSRVCDTNTKRNAAERNEACSF